MIQIAVSSSVAPNVLCPALAVLTLIALETRSPAPKPPSFPDLVAALKSVNSFVYSLVSRLASSNIQVILNALQLINSLVIAFSLPTPENPQVSSTIFDDLRDAGLLRAVAQLYENKPLAASCSPQLYDLQELLRAAFHRYATTNLDTAAVDIHAQTVRRGELLFSQLMGSSSSAAADWERAGVPENSDVVSEVNASTKWGGFQDFVDILSQDDMMLKKMYLEHLVFAPARARFPLLQAALAVTQILYDIFGISNHVLDPAYLSSVPDSFLPAPYSPSDVTSTTNLPLSSPSTASGLAIDDRTKQLHLEASTAPSSMLIGSDSSRSQSHQKTGSHSGDSAISATSFSSQGGAGHASVEHELAKLSKLRPLIFEWSSLITAGVVNFLRLWIASSAQRSDFDNIRKVVGVLFRSAIPDMDFNTATLDTVLNKLDTLSYTDLRAIQLKNIEEDLNHQWGYEIRALHNQFHQESYDFVREQRIRLLLRGEWFYIDNPVKPASSIGSSSGPSTSTLSSKPLISRATAATGAISSSASLGHSNISAPLSTTVTNVAAPTSRRYFVALSPSLNTLHYSEYPSQLPEYPSVDALSRAIDLQSISKVVVTSLSPGAHASQTRKNPLRVSLFSRTNYSRISLIFSGPRDGTTLTFYTDTPEKAAAWGDGLLMLKNKPYQSKETKKYIDMFAETKLRLQMLQVTPTDYDYASRHNSAEDDFDSIVPSDNYFYS